MTSWLFLGAKEYPFGHGQAQDKNPSGGYEKFAEALSHELAKRGDSIHIVTRYFKNAKNTPPPKNVHVHRVAWLSGTLLRNPSFNIMALKKAASLDFDVILTQGPMAAAAAHFLKIFKKKPVIALPAGVASGQPQYNKPLNAAISTIEKFAYSRADCIVFLSEAEKIQFQAKLGFTPKNNTVIAPGVKIPKKTIRKKTTTPRLLFVGRLVKVKGADYLLHAMTHLKNRLDIVGNGPEETNLKTLAKKLELKNVHFHGYQNPDSYYKKADVFVLPSISEGLPMALLEAAAHELACVITDIGLPFKNNQTALVVPAKNPVSLKKYIAALDNAILRRRLSQNARKYVQKNYSWKKTAEHFSKLAKKWA
jgi:L-malate glycosyltransferase